MKRTAEIVAARHPLLFSRPFHGLPFYSCHPAVNCWAIFSRPLVAGSLNECSFTNYNPALQQWLEIFGASAGGNELYIHAPKSSRYRHILRFGVMTADVMSLNVNDGSCQCDVEGHTYKLQILAGGVPAFRDNDNLVAKGYYATIEFVLLKWVPYVCFFFQDSLIAVTNRRLNPIPESEAEDLFGSMSSFCKNEWWRRHYWELLDPNPETTCGTYVAETFARCRSLYTPDLSIGTVTIELILPTGTYLM